MTNRDKHNIHSLLRERILLLDGGLGTMIQGYGLTEDDFRSERFASWEHTLRGCNDVLVLTRPDIIADIHQKYLSAGADIISTNSFNANAISLAEYGLAEYAGEIAKRAAEVARTVAEQFTARNPHKPRFVAGSVGPTSKSSSIATNVEHPELREVTFEQLVDAYRVQSRVWLMEVPTSSLSKPYSTHLTPRPHCSLCTRFHMRANAKYR